MLATDLARVNKVCFLEDDNRWYSISIPHPAVLKAVNGTPTFRLANHLPSADDLTQGRFYPSKNGAAYIPAPGTWYVNVPLAGSSPAIQCFFVYDCASPESAQLLYQSLVAGGMDVNLKAIGGTDQTAADLVKLLCGAITADDCERATVGTSTGEVVPARSGRTLLTVKNTSTGGQTISCSFATAGAADGFGVVLLPGEWYTWAWPNCPEAALNAIASGSDALLAYAQYYRA